MMIAHIDGATRICGKAQGYLGLPVRDEVIDCTVNGQGTPAMVTAWQPTPEELEALNRGASVHVRILGITPPPMMVSVGPAPDLPAAHAQCDAASEVQDTWLVGGEDLKAMSGSIDSDRVIQLHFKRRATDKDREWLLKAINAQIKADRETAPLTPAAIEDQAAIDEIERLQGLITQLRAQVAPPAASEGPFNTEMPSSLNDACRRLDLAQERISQLEAQVESAAASDRLIGAIEERFPNWKSYRDLIDCIDCTLHDLRKEAGQ